MFCFRARAAVPVWVVGFDANTDYEKSLEVFLFNLMEAIQERNEDWQAAFKLAQIEQARHDVNELIYEAFSELKEEPLLLEYHSIKTACQKLPFTDFSVGGTGAVGACKFIDQIDEILKSRGITITFQAPNAEDIKDMTPEQLAKSKDLCIYGVKTSDGECITIKKEGRIIRNPDDYLFEEPIQKARNFLYCYFGPWRHFPWGNTTGDCQSQNDCYIDQTCQANKCTNPDGSFETPADRLRDAMKNYFLLAINRKLKFLETAPPQEWYTQARCQKILATLQCGPNAGATESSPNLGAGFLMLSNEQACKYHEEANSPTLAMPLNQINWSWEDLNQVISKSENDAVETFTKVANTVQAIISDYQQLRKAEYIAGQGIRPEQYEIGYQAYTPEEYKQVMQTAEGFEGSTGGTIGSTKPPAPKPTGKYYYFTTEDIISPSVILLDKLQAATQAEFNMAQNAFKVKPDQIAYIQRQIENGTGFVAGNLGADNRWYTPNFESNSSDRRQEEPCGSPIHPCSKQTQTNPQGETILSPNQGALPAPWEDTLLQLPKEYYNWQAPKSEYEEPRLKNNYFNKWYKDILEMHKKNYGTILKQWFQKPLRSHFVPER